MAKGIITKLTACTFAMLSLSAFAQDSSKSEVKEVDAIVIGKKQNVAKVDSQRTEKAVFPGAIEVTDVRDSKVFHIIPATDEVIEERIKKLENIMPMPYNDHVKRYIDYFLYKRPSFVKQMLERKEFYFPIFEKYLVKYNMPPEMKYLALLESGLDPNAVSRARAVGLWQFMSYTGKEYGLRITDYQDERRHLEKATDASFRYLTNLYNMFNDWELALASYNTGPGRIRRAIRRSGHSDYWALHNYIHRDTRAYVPQWEALNYLMNYSAEHGIFPDYEMALQPVEMKHIVVDGPLNLETFSALNYMDYKTLQLLNPHLLKSELPDYARQVEIQMPLETFEYYAANKSCIMDSAQVLQGAHTNYIAHEDAKGEYHIEQKEVKHSYRVRSGDNLSTLAGRFHVYVSDLKRWNGLKSSMIRNGQYLVYFKSESVKVYDVIAKEKEEKVQIAQQKTATAPAKSKEGERTNLKVASAEKTVAENKGKTKEEPAFHYEKKNVMRYHTIRNGENLIELAQRYGTTVSQLMEWNDIHSKNRIYKGQKLKYYTTISEKVFESEESKDAGQANDKSFIVHVVQKGDTLWNISQRYGYSVAEIKKWNNLTGNTVKVGQKIKLEG
ncbi:LysM peptidoglycan-binding domain-containing protein [Marinilongibacter aquaticus]|uniref:LysM peptidoglycan-binding domain-containing protein n=1 Tax=Marinilongibacter aquaticus TaxID=2975157 RepID=UPI0021BD0159|nr:LysM peptidoglycan-binding domain-containing protein [Marinilongibacter aquaticus]UBM60411.1 LysM peptidoglycan-binding domain-containing protein [Marinilongibacter aquaticus]